MRRLIAVLLLVMLPIALFANVGPLLMPTTAQATISLKTTVPAFLVHGFLEIREGSPEIVSSAEVDNAFESGGASFTYAIKTNVSIPLKVTAAITPFQRVGVAVAPAQVKIEKVLVKDDRGVTEKSITPTGEDSLELLVLTPYISGLATYSYVLTVFADQNDIGNAPSGEYAATVSIGIIPDV